MKKIKITLGVTWAFVALIMIIILFPGINDFSSRLSKLSFMKIHPRYSGGDPGSRIISGRCTLDIRKPVFKGLISDRENGFVQLDWRGDLPELLNDSVDYDNDGLSGFYYYH